MRFDHVALATRDATPALAVLVGELGGTALSGGLGPGFRPMQVFLGDDAGGMKVELLEPWQIESNDFLERFLTRHGDGPHHLTFKVPDLAAAVDEARARGFAPVGIDLSDPEWREAFLPPREAHGTVVQLAESNLATGLPLDEYRHAAAHGPFGEEQWWTVPDQQAERATVLRRVVLRAPVLEPALTFFGGFLEGATVDAGPGWAELSWPGDGRVRIEEQPDAVPGVDRLELDGDGPRRDLTVARTRLVVTPA